MSVLGLTADARNFGDVLRQVAESKEFKDDFVVVRTDLITNIDIRPAIKMHYQVKEMQSKAETSQMADIRKFKTVLTKLFIRMDHGNPLRSPDSDISLLMDE